MMYLGPKNIGSEDVGRPITGSGPVYWVRDTGKNPNDTSFHLSRVVQISPVASAADLIVRCVPLW